MAKFLDFLAKPENAAEWHQKTGYLPITKAAYDLTREQGFYEKNPGADTATRQMLNKPPLPFTKGLRLGNMPQIRVIVDEELESVWTGKKTPQQALDTAVERGNQLLRRFEIDEVLISVMSDAFRLSDLASRVGRISEAHPAQFRN